MAPPIPAKEERVGMMTSFCPLFASGWSWRNQSQWRVTGLLCKKCRITLPWLVLDLPLCIKDTDILALDYVAERLLLRFNAAAAGNISEGICSFTARCHCCLCPTAEPFSVLKVSSHTRAAL